MSGVNALSQEQRQRALVIANAERVKRAELGQLFGELGHKGAAEQAARILADCHERYGRMRIGDFLLKIPDVGDAKVDEYLRRSGWSINPRRRVTELTVKERWHIITRLEGRA